MAVVKIENFGGEMPSVSPRMLGAAGAQENRNLYTGIAEFRPLMLDAAVAGCPPDTKTMHRFARKADGTFNADPATGWIFSQNLRSYVKGQINDERTERTYYSVDDGSEPPRAIDVTGADRKLGVPRPVKPAVSLSVTDELTQEEASNFLYGEAAEAIRQAIIDSTTNPANNEPASRFVGTTIKAGPYSSHGLAFPTSTLIPSALRTNHWDLVGIVPIQRAIDLGLVATTLEATVTPASMFVSITSLPFTILPDRALLESKLRAIQKPAGSADKSGNSTAGQQLFTDAKITELADAVIKTLDPSEWGKSFRDELDAVTKEFARLITTATSATLPSKPSEPTKPTVPEYTYDPDFGASVRSPQWVAYDAAYATYVAAMQDYNAAVSGASSGSNSLNTKLAELRSRARIATQAVEAEMVRAWAALTKDTSLVSSRLSAGGGVSAFVGETVTRIIDTRFYIVTFVTDWGEESEPSEVSDLLEPDQNDSCTVNRPALTTGEPYATRNIVKWRLYRSNVGSQTAAFQFVDEMLIATANYTDEKKGAELGEVCPSTTWTEPPYRQDVQAEGWPKPVVGTNPFLRGLTGMPNGIMAGFLDNTVAFCEPYIPYAWPVEYQITTEHPIVGLGVFDTTLFVGTTGNPYFISGSDSASMSAQKLDSNQSCVSALSIVSVQGGVLYVSPDGLCLAAPGGVQVVSQGLYTREDWQTLNPSSMMAVEHERIYYLFYDNGTPGCLSFDLTSKKLGRVDLSADAVFVDKLNDVLYTARGASVTAVFGGTLRRTARWKSARQVLPLHASLAWVQAYGDQTADNPVTVRWYGDGELKYTATLNDTKPQRLPAGRWVEHEVEVESKSRVTSLMLASSTGELQQI
jgi:hypothetical protein